MVAAGEALNPEVLRAWREATGLEIRDGYGQTETGQMTGMPLGERGAAGLDGQGAARACDLTVEDGELVADPASVPTFFLGYLGEDVGAARTAPGGRGPPRGGPWRTGDRVHEDEDGWLYFEGRADDVIVSAGYRIGPFEVESALVAHPAVAEAAAVAAPDEERGAVVRAVVVLRDGHAPSPALARELQEHVKRETAPYKYPRIVDFADELPKTASGKVRASRAAELRRSPRVRRRGAQRRSAPLRRASLAALACSSSYAPRASSSPARHRRAAGVVAGSTEAPRGSPRPPTQLAATT